MRGKEWRKREGEGERERGIKGEREGGGGKEIVDIVRIVTKGLVLMSENELRDVLKSN